MHADELPIDAELVARLVRSQFPQWAHLPLARVASSGTVNALFRLGSDLLVRLPLLASGADEVEFGHRLLPALAPLLPVAIPEPLGLGVPGEGYPCPWSVYGWLPGDNPEPDSLTEPDLLAADLAGFITALRRVELDDPPQAYRGGPLGPLDHDVRDCLGQLAGVVDTEGLGVIWEAALAAPSWSEPPVWVHSDLLPGNLLVADGRLSAVLDFETAGVGDPACDLMVAWSLLPVRSTRVFREALGVDDATWLRGQGWALSMAVIALPYYYDTNPGMASLARHIIGELHAGAD